MQFPIEYREKDYIDWHEKEIPEDYGLQEKINDYRARLKVDKYEDLDFLANHLSTITTFFAQEYEQEFGAPCKFTIPMLDLFKSDKQVVIESEDYNFLFKSTPSIINKLWRKNKIRRGKQETYITTQNLEQEIWDLVRTNIITPSLTAAKKLVKSIATDTMKYNAFIQDEPKKIDSIDIEPEMKMDKGYFAYHGVVNFSSGLKMEVQVYSELSKIWREISHKVYEEQRGQKNEKYDFNDKSSRLISLGHLLHLGECEIERLSDDILKRK